MYIFNRIFNNLVNKICWLLLIIIVALTFFFLGLWKADAAEISYSSASYQLGNISLLSGSSSNSGYQNLGTSYVYDGNSYLNVLYLQTFGNSSIIFKEGNTYTFTYLINFNPKYDLSEYHFDKTTLLWYGNTSASNSTLNSDYISNGTINIENITDGSYQNYQMRFTFSFTPTTDLKYVLFRLQFPVQSTSSPSFSCGSASGSCPYVLNSFNVLSLKINEETGTAGAIQNQTNIIINNQNQNTDKVIDSITDNNTDTSEEEGAGFFNDFELNDNGGISGIVTAPLTVINGLVEGNNQCANLTFDIKAFGYQKNVSLPSGCIVWDKAPDSVEVLYQTLICGLFAYIIGTNLFKDIENLKDPKESEVDTLDL